MKQQARAVLSLLDTGQSGDPADQTPATEKGLKHADEFRLTTPRLLLRDFTEADLPQVHALRSDPRVTRFMGFTPESLQQSRVWLKEIIFHNQVRPRRAYNLAIAIPADDQVIGWIGIGDSSRYPTKGELGFGYMVQHAHWGQGYMTEALQAVCNFGFRVLKAQRISDFCHAENRASARVMEKAGLRFERRFQDTDPISGQTIECLEYALRADEWKQTASDC